MAKTEKGHGNRVNGVMAQTDDGRLFHTAGAENSKTFEVLTCLTKDGSSRQLMQL